MCLEIRQSSAQASGYRIREVRKHYPATKSLEVRPLQWLNRRTKQHKRWVYVWQEPLGQTAIYLRQQRLRAPRIWRPAVPRLCRQRHDHACIMMPGTPPKAVGPRPGLAQSALHIPSRSDARRAQHSNADSGRRTICTSGVPVLYFSLRCVPLPNLGSTIDVTRNSCHTISPRQPSL